MIITAGKYKGRKLFSPDEHISRPTLSKIRMGVFNSLYSILGDFENKSFLDLFGGSGIMGLEALSRGFMSVKVYELNRKSAEIINKNYSLLGLSANLNIGDSINLLDKSDEYFDVVYIDPPYSSDLYNAALEKINCNIAILESSIEFNFKNYNIIKQKKYGNTYITFLSK